MRKNNFLEGAMFATFGIIISRILGLIYVIPFYSLIGSQGGALYSYGYSIYGIFLSLSSSGIPIAISRLISEYSALEYYYTKEKVYRLGLKMIAILSVTFFILLMVSANGLAGLIIGDVKGGNTVESVALIIRVIATALLVVPFTSVTRGYLQGQKYMTPSSVSNVIEQLVRVTVVVGGSFFALKVFNLSLETAVGVAIFGATIGSIAAYLYLATKIHRNKQHLNQNKPITRDEKRITTNDLIKKIIMYSLPFIMIDLMNALTTSVDTFTIVRVLDGLGYQIKVIETAFSTINTWGIKINMIVISIVLGLSISLIPHIASSYALKDFKDVEKKVNQAYQSVLFLTIPMALGISFLAQPVWVAFYSYDVISISIIRLMILETILGATFVISLNSMQAINNTKHVMKAITFAFVGKILINIPMMYLLDFLGFKSYFGPSLTNMLLNIGVISYIIYIYKKKYNFSFIKTIDAVKKMVISCISMLLILYLITYIVPVNAVTKLDAVFEIALYGTAGALAYFGITHYNGLLYEIFGHAFVNRILVKLHLKKA